MAKRKLKPEPCPNCGNADLIVGDCGYSSFNVAWVKCPKCKLEIKVTGDNAVSSWNKWCSDPISELIREIREDASFKRRQPYSDGMTMKEFATYEIEKMYNTECGEM